MRTITHRNNRLPSTLRTLTVAAVVAALVAGCGGGPDVASPSAQDGSPQTSAETTAPDDGAAMDDMPSEGASEDMGEGMDMAGSYGEPADPSETDRTVEVNVDNDLAFEPADFTAAVGEVITFRITNTGDVEHEFVLGDEQAQEQMAETMESGEDHAHSGDMSNAVTIHAGETGELTWRFTTEGPVLIGCHVPGHWDAGMRGTVTVTG